MVMREKFGADVFKDGLVRHTVKGKVRTVVKQSSP